MDLQGTLLSGPLPCMTLMHLTALALSIRPAGLSPGFQPLQALLQWGPPRQPIGLLGVP